MPSWQIRLQEIDGINHISQGCSILRVARRSDRLCRACVVLCPSSPSGAHRHILRSCQAEWFVVVCCFCNVSLSLLVLSACPVVNIVTHADIYRETPLQKTTSTDFDNEVRKISSTDVFGLALETESLQMNLNLADQHHILTALDQIVTFAYDKHRAKMAEKGFVEYAKESIPSICTVI